MLAYRSARGLAQAVIALVALQVLLDLVAVAACASVLMEVDLPQLFSAVQATQIVFLSAALYFAAVVVFMCWVHRSVANLGALGSYSVFQPAAAVWAFFIPIVNMSRPHTVLATIWTESQPAGMTDAGYALPRSTTLVTGWWSLVVVSTLFSRFIMRLADRPQDQDGVNRALLFAIIEGLLWCATGVLFVHMVRRTQQRQDEQWKDLQQRQAVPQPDPNALR